jgi:tetratricopeptide (TPR) repeat protein
VFVTSLLDRQRERFLADPDDERAFQALEEDLFLAGDWDGVMKVYERRLEAPSIADQPRERAAIHCRRGQVYQDRRNDLDLAIECYREALNADAQHRPALSRLRKLYATRSQWDVALQIAELEAALPLRPVERAGLLAEMGSIWLEQLGDRQEAIAHFKRALTEDPSQIDALEGSARVFEAAGQTARAADAWDRIIELLRGPARANALVARARLADGSLRESKLAIELYRRALTDDPNNATALEAIANQASADANWTLLTDVQERRFELASDPAQRVKIARETGRMQRENLSNPSAAQLWLERAIELDPNDLDSLDALADLARDRGEDDALVSYLERLRDRATDSPPVSVLLELASLYSDRGDPESAYRDLELAHRLAPDDTLVAEALCETLGRLGRDEELVEVLEQRASGSGLDSSTRAMVLSELASILETRLDDTESACHAYQRAFELDPSTAGVTSALERLFRKSEDWDSLRSFLERAAHAALPDQRTRYSCTLAALLNDQFNAPDEAKRVLEAVLAVEPDSITALRGLQHLASASGDDDAVLRAYELEAAISGNASRLAFLVGELVPRLEARDRTPSALAWVERWVAVAPEDPKALMASSRLREKLGQDAELAADLERLDRLVPSADKAGLRRRLGELHAARGRVEEAIAAYRGAAEADPEDDVALDALATQLDGAGRLQELAEVQRRLVDLLPAPRRTACLDQLASLLADRLGDLNGAIEVLGRLSSERDAPPNVDERREMLLERAARFEELASHLAARAAKLDPSSAEAQTIQLRRADVLLEHLDLFSEAAGAYRKIYTNNPDSEPARIGLEKALRATGDPAGLADFLDEQMQSTSDPRIRDRSGLERAVLLEESLDRTDESIDLLRRLAESAVDESFRTRASERLEILLERTGDWEGLRRHLEESLHGVSGDGDVGAYERLGMLYRDRLRNLPRAVDQFEAATTIAPERADLWRVLADLYSEEGRADDVVTALEAEIATSPEAGRELNLRSRAAQLCIDELRDRERAREHYERVLELDSTHSAAVDFLMEHWKRNGNFAEVVRLLEARLKAIENSDPGEPELITSLRLQISGLRATELDDLDGAIAALSPAVEEVGPQPFVAEPLADLYRRTSRNAELIALCRSAATACTDSYERAGWFTQLGDALCAESRDTEAAEAYRSALSDRPDDNATQAVLREVYRRLGESEPLVRMLEMELSHISGNEEIPVRIELAELLTAMPARRPAALLHLRRILQIDPDQSESLDRALDLAEALQRESGANAGTEAVLELLNAALSQPKPPSVRAAHLTRRARFLQHVVARLDEAVADYREALTLDPSRTENFEQLRRALESQGQWKAALDCVFQQAQGADGARRLDLLNQAVEIAWEHLGADATLPWLERLRLERPGDAEVNARIAEIHRRAGRHEATLRALESQVACVEDPARLRDLHLERARIFERELGFEGRAAAALEDARRAAPDDAELLRNLAALYERLGRDRERVGVLEDLVAHAPADDRVALLRQIARLYGGPLADPKRASTRLLSAIAEIQPRTPLHGELLRELRVALRQSRDSNSWASCAEEELRNLDPDAHVFEDRRRELHRELARTYEQKLGQPDNALQHLRALADSAGDDAALEFPTAAADSSLLRLLRVQGNWIELERRLSTHLKRRPDDSQGWLELGRLRDERLQSTAAAAAAYQQVLDREPGCLPALRALRSAVERLGRWSDVAKTLEHEFEHASPATPAARAALLRRLGDIYWRRVRSTTQASRSYAAALEADPNDFEAVRSLEQLLEAMEDWRGALGLYESEIEMLGDAEPDRRFSLSLRVAEIARDHTDEPNRAVRSYEYAAAIAALPASHLRELAQLYERAGDREAFARTFEQWCDDAESGASNGDQLKLAAVLEELGNVTAAHRRIERVLEAHAEYRPAWDAAARLREQTGDARGAAEALSIAADLSDDAAACARLIRAAELCGDESPEQAAERLRSALRRDPCAADAQARLAQLASELGEFQEAERAAERALDLAANGLDRDLQLAAALAGGRAARELDHPDVAARCYAAALEVSPEHSTALAQYGEALARSGDLSAAKRILELRLAQPGPNPDRASQLAVVGRAQWAADEHEAAVESLEAALREDPRLDDAHETLVALWEAKGSIDAGIACLERWADVASNHALRGERLLRAAEWELATGDHVGAAERHLREVLEADPSGLRPWEALASLLWEAERAEEALEVTSLAISGVEQVATSPVLYLIQGRALQQLGETEEAAEAFRAAATADPGCVEATLARARLLRGLGEWQAAADALRDFQEAYRGEDRDGLAEVLQQLGRLLAGPLEDPEGAIAVYREAIKLDPDRIEMHAALAEFLSHRPGDWEEALTHHRWVLNAEPTHLGSLRVLMRVSRERGNPQAIATGLGIVSALGIASPAELEEELTAKPCYGGIRELSNPRWEKLRVLANDSAQEIASALDSPDSDTGDAREDPLAAFHGKALAAEGRLTAPALLPLTTRELRELMMLIAALSIDPGRVSGDGSLVNAISSAVKRRLRRRLRIHLKGESMDSLDRVDFDAWRNEVRAMASAIAVDETGIDLRTALTELTRDSSDVSSDKVTPPANLTAWAAARPATSALLRQAIRSWLSQL